MLKIELTLNSDLKFDGNKIAIAKSADSGNAFELKSDGIYLDKTLISSGVGFIDQSGTSVRIGFIGLFDGLNAGQYPEPGRVSATNTVHRFFDSVTTTQPTVGWRNVDTILPGDLIRIPNQSKYDYYLVTNVTEGSSLNGFTNNAVTSTVLLGTW